MTTVILAEKPSQARSYVQAFQKSTKKQGYYTVSDPVLPENTLVTYGLGHLVELATPDKYDQKYSNGPYLIYRFSQTNTSLKCQLVKERNSRSLKTC
ncbi:DNA topoisomerase 3 (plasmid) [Lactiplantibacillus plantarum]|nr:DNA topoisomerase 3 [Lactiplantibacillus plantarum]